jgi:dipeptide/tripeptide permease
MVFVLVEMWERFCFYGMWGTRHFMADKVSVWLYPIGMLI